MSYQPPFTITSKMLTLVSEIVEIITDIKHIEVSLKTPKLRKKNRIKSITGTLQIEGNTFSEEKVTNVINGKTVLGTMREITEVQGAIRAYEHFDTYTFKSEKDLLKSHKLMMEKLVSSAGSYRNMNAGVGSNNVITHIAPPPYQVPELMGNLFEWLQNTKDHPLIVSCVFHYEFEFIHPFQDGNGRVGRLWQSVILNHYKKIFGFIPIESVVREYQASYYKALEASGSAGESTPFIEYMLEIILKTLKNSSNENVPKNVPKNRLDEIVKLIEKNKEITSIQIAQRLKVSDKTIKRDMAALKEQGRLQRVGSLKSGHWEVLNDK